MLKNAVVIIPKVSDEKQVCDFLAQTAAVLRQNNFVYVLNYYAAPRILPLRRFALINQLNRLIYFFFWQLYLRFKHQSASAFYWWIFFPELAALCKIKLLGWRLVYDVVDFHFAPQASEVQKLEKQKKALLAQADYVFSISKTLKRLYQPFCPREIKVVPQGFALQEFATEKISALKLPTGKPIIGFTGQISERLDLQLLDELVGANKAWNFVFIGPIRHEPNVALALDEQLIDKITKYSNAFYFQGQKRQELLSLIKQFDICMIPYDVSYDFNRYCYPMKLFECFYAGKPIVSTPIEELSRFEGLVYVGSDAQEWQTNIKFLLEEGWAEKQKKQQRELALSNSWESKMEKVSSHLDE